MVFSFWSRTALQLLLRIRKRRGVPGASELFDVLGSAWWKRIVTDYVFCFAFCTLCRITIWGEVSLSWQSGDNLNRAPVISVPSPISAEA